MGVISVLSLPHGAVPVTHPRGMPQGLPWLRRCQAGELSRGGQGPSGNRVPGASSIQQIGIAGIPLEAGDPSSCWMQHHIRWELLDWSWGSQQLLDTTAEPQWELLGEPGAAQGWHRLCWVWCWQCWGWRAVRAELGWGKLHSMQDKSLSDSIPRLQAGPGAADGAEALQGMGRGKGGCKQGPRPWVLHPAAPVEHKLSSHPRKQKWLEHLSSLSLRSH